MGHSRPLFALFIVSMSMTGLKLGSSEIGSKMLSATIALSLSKCSPYRILLLKSSSRLFPLSSAAFNSEDPVQNRLMSRLLYSQVTHLKC